MGFRETNRGNQSTPHVDGLMRVGESRKYLNPGMRKVNRVICVECWNLRARGIECRCLFLSVYFLSNYHVKRSFRVTKILFKGIISRWSQDVT